MTDSATDLQAKLAAESEEGMANAARIFAWLFFLVGSGLLVWSFFMDLHTPVKVENGMILGGQLDMDHIVHAIMTCLAGAGLLITGAVLLGNRHR